MSEDRTPRLLYWLMLVAMLLSGLATADALDAQTSRRAAFSIAILVVEAGVAAFSVVMLARTRRRR